MNIRRRMWSTGVVLVVLTWAASSSPRAGMEVSPFAMQEARLQAVLQVLDAATMKLERLFFLPYESPERAPEGLAGAIGAATRQLAVVARSLVEVRAALPADPEALPATTAALLQSAGTALAEIGDMARRGRAYTRDLTVVAALDALSAATHAAAAVIGSWVPVVASRTIPMRFVQVRHCNRGDAGCDPLLDRDALVAAADAMNRAFGAAGVRFWPKSLEHYRMDSFASTTASEGSTMDFYAAREELLPALSIPHLSAPPSSRRPSSWLHWAATLFGEPSEVLVWIVPNDSVVARANGASISSLPEGGRASTLISSNVFLPPDAPGGPFLSPNHVVHEMGHYFGLPHTWEGPRGLNPHTMQPRTWPDMWDLAYCPGTLTGLPLFFNSAEAARAANCAYTTIEANPCPCGTFDDAGDCTCPAEPNCSVNNRTGADASDMRCHVAGADYYSGDRLLKGLSFPTGLPEDPPVGGASYWDPWSFGWGLNVMGYYSRYWAHLWMPGLFSQSQLHLIRGYLENDIPISGDYAPYVGLTTNFTRLGTDTADHLWWSNGNFTFGRQYQSIPVPGQRPAVGDFDGNGFDDLLWFGVGDTGTMWRMRGDRSWLERTGYHVGPDYIPVTGDFDGNGTSDILWYRPGSAYDRLWRFSLSTFDYVESYPTVDGDYDPVAGNFDGLHGDDIAWYDRAAGRVNFWWSNGDGTFTHQDHVWVGLDFRPVAGDFDGDGFGDIYWLRRGPATDEVWWGAASRSFRRYDGDSVQMAMWATPLAGDFTGDGVDDILWDVPLSLQDEAWQWTPRGFVSRRVMVSGHLGSVAGRFDRDPGSDIFRYRK